MIKRLLLLILLLFSLSVQAAEKIVDVDFVGLTSTPENSVRSRILSIEGVNYSKRTIKSDIKRLYKTGLFGNVTVKKERVAGGYKVVFVVQEKKTIGKLVVEGNKKFSEDELAEALKVNEYEFLDKAKIAQTKTAIYKLYEEKGYYLVQITTEINPFDEDANQVELVFRIKENRPVKIRRIKFIGNRAFSDKKLRKKMKIKEKNFLSFISSSGKLENEKLKMDKQLLSYYYLDNGYVKVKVDDPSVTLTRDKRSIYISFPVHEGEQYKVSTIDVAGDILTTKDEIIGLLAQKPGDEYRKSLEIQDLKSIERFYGDQAYAFANIYPHLEPNENDKTVKVTYYVQKGEKIRVGKIFIKGNSVTRDKVVRRELKLIENAFFSQSALDRSKMRLYQLGFFEDVNFSTPRGEDENTVDVVIEVKEKNTGTVSVGAGFSTLESFIFTATVQKENFFGLGVGGGITANISKLRQDIIVSFNDRYFLDTKWYMGVSFERYLSQLNTDFDQDKLGGTVTMGRELFDFFHFRVGYELADLKVKNFSALVPQFFQDNASGLTSAGIGTLTYDRRDNRIFTKKGFYTSATVKASVDALGADNQYMQYTSDNRVFIPLPKKFVLKSRALVSYINSLDSNPVALFDRFFLGGVNTLRGFDINSIGPEVSTPGSATGGDTKFTYGGNKMLLINTELEIPIYAPAGFHAVAFFDAGNSFAEDQNFDVTNLRMDYGFGLRWQSPFGPLRFEWGFPINKQADESGVVFNFTIGQSF